MTTDRLPSKPGRPPVESTTRKTLTLSVRLSVSQYDTLARQAQDARVSLGEAVRRSLTRRN